MAEDLAELASSLNDLQSVQKDLDSALTSAQNRLDSAFRALDECVSQHAGQLRTCQRVEGMIRQLRAEKAQLSEEQRAQLEVYAERLRRCRTSLDRLRASKPKTGSVFLRLCLGKVNVKVWKRGERVQSRDEYEKFKFRTTFIFIIFPALQLYFGTEPLGLLAKAHSLWLCYYYASLALRENILQVNGSAIKDWWVYHHLLSMLATLVILIFPRSVQDAWARFLWFALAQGFVMMVSNRYQANRHYARRALGKAKEVDVETTETLVEKPTDLFALVPMLYCVYAFEIYFGAYIYMCNQSDPAGWVLGTVWAVLGVGNAVTTSRVLCSRARARWPKKARTA